MSKVYGGQWDLEDVNDYHWIFIFIFFYCHRCGYFSLVVKAQSDNEILQEFYESVTPNPCQVEGGEAVFPVLALALIVF